jgi:hypothetical protein
MSHKVGAITHEIGNVFGIDQKILALSRGTPPVTTSVRHQQAKAAVGQRSLRLPLVGPGCQGAVH